MPHSQRRLIVALALSLLFHLAPLLAGLLPAPSEPQHRAETPALTARLQAPQLRPAPPLTLPNPPPKAAKAAPPAAEKKPAPRPVDRPTPVKTWTHAVRQQFAEQQTRGLFYPEEAIRRGLEGEPLVLMVLDENGSVVAARIEQSSGQPLLDAAALHAVRALHSLPADAPRQVLLPVRFRLR